jgi:hypothetical protein
MSNMPSWVDDWLKASTNWVKGRVRKSNPVIPRDPRRVTVRPLRVVRWL